MSVGDNDPVVLCPREEFSGRQRSHHSAAAAGVEATTKEESPIEAKRVMIR
jgi:hypothetical protein